MSIRKGYYYFDGSNYGGPFSTMAEARLEAVKDPRIKPSKLTIRALVALERFDAKTKQWETLH